MSSFLSSILIFISIFLSSMTYSQENFETDPEVVNIGIYLIRAGSLNISTGAIKVDFYLDFICEDLCDDNQDEFELINGKITSSVQIDDDPANPTYRISATLFQKINLNQFPFDNHKIKIIIESANFESADMEYAVNLDSTQIDSDVYVLGWDIVSTASAEIVEKYYSAWDVSYNRYQYSFDLGKPALAGWLKGILPATIIILGALLSLFVNAKKIETRVAITTAALIASVLFHLNFTSKFPVIGYFTFADVFMIINYLVILLTLGLTIWLIYVENAEHEILLKKVHKLEVYMVPLLWISLHFISATFFFDLWPI